MSEVKIYSSSEYDKIPWHLNHEGEKLQEYFTPLLRDGVKKYCSNIDTELYMISINDKLLPLTINDKIIQDNCYVVSPFCHFVSYGIKELSKLNMPSVEFALKIFMSTIGFLIKFCEFDKVATINNWMFSTALYPKLSKQEIYLIVKRVRESFPDHIPYFRSISCMKENDIYTSLKELGLKDIISRPIYYQRPQEITYSSCSSLKKDRRAFRRSDYRVYNNLEIDEKYLKRFREVYFKLYIEKYSIYNPQFSLEYFHHIRKCQYLDMYALINSKGELDAGGALYGMADIITTPVLGYDTSFPSDRGLYRMVTYQIFLKGAQKVSLINRSSGAPDFKRYRKAKQVIEYNFVELRGVSLFRKMPWLFIHYLLNPLSKFFFVKFKL